MDELAGFLRARLDEDEEAARLAEAVDPSPWYEDVSEGTYTRQREGLDGVGLVRAADSVGLWDRESSSALSMAAVTSVHVARHDPARVLREVAAKRSAIREAFRHAAVVDGEWGCCHDAEQIERGECEEEVPSEMPILQALAAVYADHPDYRPEWAPTT